MTKRRLIVRSASAALAVAAVVALAGCGGGGGVDSGGLSAGDRSAAQTALDGLSGTNVARQLVAITAMVQNAPAACRVHQVSADPHTFKVYVFWIPWLGAEPYMWLDMTVQKDPSKGVYRLGTAKPVLPGGKLTPGGHSVDPWTQDTTLLSRYGAGQNKKNHEELLAHAGNVYAKPRAACQVLMNGDLRLVPNP